MARIALDDAAWASPWRRRRVGEKLLWSLGLVATALAVPSVAGVWLVGLVAVVVLVGPARIAPRRLVAVMALPMAFILVGALSVVFSVGRSPVDAWWSWGLLSVGPESWAMAGAVLAHAIAGTLGVMVLALTTPMSDLLTWLEQHRVPAPLVEIASLTYRLLFILLGTAAAILDAQRRRLGRVTIRSAGDAAGTLLVRAWDRAVRLDAGLAARGMEDSLATTAPARARSWPMIVGALGTVGGLWAAGWWLA